MNSSQQHQHHQVSLTKRHEMYKCLMADISQVCDGRSVNNAETTRHNSDNGVSSIINSRQYQGAPPPSSSRRSSMSSCSSNNIIPDSIIPIMPDRKNGITVPTFTKSSSRRSSMSSLPTATTTSTSSRPVTKIEFHRSNSDEGAPTEREIAGGGGGRFLRRQQQGREDRDLFDLTLKGSNSNTAMNKKKKAPSTTTVTTATSSSTSSSSSSSNRTDTTRHASIASDLLSTMSYRPVRGNTTKNKKKQQGQGQQQERRTSVETIQRNVRRSSVDSNGSLSVNDLDLGEREQAKASPSVSSATPSVNYKNSIKLMSSYTQRASGGTSSKSMKQQGHQQGASSRSDRRKDYQRNVRRSSVDSDGSLTINDLDSPNPNLGERPSPTTTSASSSSVNKNNKTYMRRASDGSSNTAPTMSSYASNLNNSDPSMSSSIGEASLTTPPPSSSSNSTKSKVTLRRKYTPRHRAGLTVTGIVKQPRYSQGNIAADTTAPSDTTTGTKALVPLRRFQRRSSLPTDLRQQHISGSFTQLNLQKIEKLKEWVADDSSTSREDGGNENEDGNIKSNSTSFSSEMIAVQSSSKSRQMKKSSSSIQVASDDASNHSLSLNDLEASWVPQGVDFSSSMEVYVFEK